MEILKAQDLAKRWGVSNAMITRLKRDGVIKPISGTKSKYDWGEVSVLYEQYKAQKEDPLLTASEVAIRLGTSAPNVSKAIARGDLVATGGKSGDGRNTLISTSSVLQFEAEKKRADASRQDAHELKVAYNEVKLAQAKLKLEQEMGNLIPLDVAVKKIDYVVSVVAAFREQATKNMARRFHDFKSSADLESAIDKEFETLLYNLGRDSNSAVS